MKALVEYVLYAVLLLTVVIVTQAYFKNKNTDDSNVVPLSWQPFDNVESRPYGYLVLLKNSLTGKTVYISSAKEPEPTEYEIAENWSLQSLINEQIWDPKVCASTPTVIDNQGDIFMLDVYKTRTSFTNRFVWYQKDKNQTLEVIINDLEPIGTSLFLNENNQPSFFAIKNNDFLVYSFNSETETLTVKKLGETGPNENYLIKRNAEKKPVVVIFDETTVTTVKYLYDNGRLIRYDGPVEEKNSFEYIDQSHKLIKIDDDLKAKSSLEDAYETEVLQAEKTILKFKPEAKVYSFVIGSVN